MSDLKVWIEDQSPLNARLHVRKPRKGVNDEAPWCAKGSTASLNFDTTRKLGLQPGECRCYRLVPVEDDDV